MTGLIIAIVVIAIIALIVFAVAMPRARAKAREREMARRRDEVATAHRERAEDRAARADYAEQQAARERAEAELHETRARMHERGLADDELDTDRERLGVGDADRDGEPGRAARGERFDTERDAEIAREERR
jgi:flagellar biosynthesis/type III secretory pathway M-ring protein FliF/YscJ